MTKNVIKINQSTRCRFSSRSCHFVAQLVKKFYRLNALEKAALNIQEKLRTKAYVELIGRFSHILQNLFFLYLLQFLQSQQHLITRT